MFLHSFVSTVTIFGIVTESPPKSSLPVGFADIMFSCVFAGKQIDPFAPAQGILPGWPDGLNVGNIPLKFTVPWKCFILNSLSADFEYGLFLNDISSLNPSKIRIAPIDDEPSDQIGQPVLAVK